MSTHDDWEKEFQNWKKKDKSLLNPGHRIQPRPEIKIEEPEISQVTHKSKKISSKFSPFTIFLILLALGIISLYLVSTPEISTTVFVIAIISIFILIALFLALLFIHRVYESTIHNLNPSFILALSYALIIANILLGSKIYSLEWAFLAFLAITVVFYDFKIDSRFLILPALLLLGYIPFLLLGAQEQIAEKVAVFVYYFLVTGVVLQIIEYHKKTKNSLDFTSFLDTFISKEKTITLISIWGVITLAIIILNRFYSLELIKWSSIYVFVVLIIFYLIAHFQEQKQYPVEL